MCKLCEHGKSTRPWHGTTGQAAGQRTDIRLAAVIPTNQPTHTHTPTRQHRALLAPPPDPTLKPATHPPTRLIRSLAPSERSGAGGGGNLRSTLRMRL